MGATTILDSLADRSYVIRNLCTLTSFGRSIPQEHVDILHWQYRVIIVALSVFGVLCMCILDSIECVMCIRNSSRKTSIFATILTIRTRYVQALAQPSLWLD